MDMFDVNGTTIGVEQMGAGTPLLLIHGGLISHTEWRPQHALAERFRLLMPDVRGHGESGNSPEPYSVALFAADMVALLDRLELERVIVVGHSMGGMIGQEMAVSHPDRVLGLVIAESNHGTGDDPIISHLVNLSSAVTRLLGVRNALKLLMGVYKGKPEVVEVVRTDFDRHADNPDNFWNIVQALSTFAVKTRLSTIQCPTLVMVGARNRMTHRQAQTMLRLIDNAALAKIPDAGHMLNWDNPAAFNRAVAEFAGRVAQ